MSTILNRRNFVFIHIFTITQNYIEIDIEACGRR